MGREDERSGGRPPPDATKREGGTGIPSDAGSVEGLSTSESSLSREDTTPPMVVLVVPGTGRRYNGPREAIPQSEKAETTPPQATGATRPDAQPQESAGGELVDREMIYLDGGGSVGSMTTCSDTERAGADHRNQEDPPLEQPSETDTDGSKQSSTDMDIYYCSQGRDGSNNGWEYEEDWSEGKIKEKLEKKPPNPQIAVLKAEFAKRRGQPETDEVMIEVWWGKKISANHPSQAQEFGIGDMLTTGTSDGEVTSDKDGNRGSSTSGSTPKELWTLVQKKIRGAN